MTTVNAQSIREEAAWIPVELDQAAAILEVAERHFTSVQASGLVGWLIRKAMGQPDRTGPPTRAKYRRMIRELEAAGETPPTPTGDRRVREGVEAIAATGVPGVGAKAAEIARARALAAEGGFVTVTVPVVAVAVALVANVAQAGSFAGGVLSVLPDITSTRSDGADGVGEESEDAGQPLATIVDMRTRLRIAGRSDARHHAHSLPSRRAA